MATVFLTGATGFIGKELLRQLAKQNHQILALVRSLEKWERIVRRYPELGGGRIKAVKGDLALPHLGLSEDDMVLVRQADVMIHAAAPMDITLGEDEAKRTILGGTEAILGIAEEIQRGQGLRHFIHVVGYMSPFGEGSADRSADVYAMHDFMPEASPYERYKFLADLLVRQGAARVGFPLSVVNPATVIGYRDSGSTEQLAGFGLLVEAVRRKKMPVVPGGDDHWLPLVAVDDLARLITALVNQSNPATETYFVLEPKENSPGMSELLQRIARELGMKGPSKSVPIPVIRRLLQWGGSRLTGMSHYSTDFITARRFPTDSLERLKRGGGAARFACG